MKQIETGLQVLACAVWNEPELSVSCLSQRLQTISPHLSPCMRGLLRLGLAIGVLSRALPACSKSFSAFDSADASTGSELRLRLWLRLCEAVGGVFDSGGEISVGVAAPSSCAVSVDRCTVPRRAMLVRSPCREPLRCASWRTWCEGEGLRMPRSGGRL